MSLARKFDPSESLSKNRCYLMPFKLVISEGRKDGRVWTESPCKIISIHEPTLSSSCLRKRSRTVKEKVQMDKRNLGTVYLYFQIIQFYFAYIKFMEKKKKSKHETTRLRISASTNKSFPLELGYRGLGFAITGARTVNQPVPGSCHTNLASVPPPRTVQSRMPGRGVRRSSVLPLSLIGCPRFGTGP